MSISLEQLAQSQQILSIKAHSDRIIDLLKRTSNTLEEQHAIYVSLVSGALLSYYIQNYKGQEVFVFFYIQELSKIGNKKSINISGGFGYDKEFIIQLGRLHQTTQCFCVSTLQNQDLGTPKFYLYEFEI